MDTSAITGTTSSTAYVPSTSTSSSGSSDFASILASQTNSSDTIGGTSSTSAAEQALSSYSAGQVKAYNLQSEDTTGTTTDTALKETTSTAGTSETSSTTTAAASSSASSESAETSESESTGETAAAEGAGFPAEVNSEWTPGHMQFFDESTGQWMDDNIPHRITDNGDLQYYADGEWHQDTAVKHRMVDENGNAIAMVDEEGNPITSDTASTGEGTSSEGAQTASSSEAAPSAEVYFNEALQTWKLYNLPGATDQNGNRMYYWGDSWHTASWQHHDATGSGVAVAGDPTGSAGIAATTGTETASSSGSGTESGSDTTAQAA